MSRKNQKGESKKKRKNTTEEQDKELLGSALPKKTPQPKSKEQIRTQCRSYSATTVVSVVGIAAALGFGVLDKDKVVATFNNIIMTTLNNEAPATEDADVEETLPQPQVNEALLAKCKTQRKRSLPLARREIKKGAHGKWEKVAMYSEHLFAALPQKILEKNYRDGSQLTSFRSTWTRWLLRDVHAAGEKTASTGEMCISWDPLLSLPDTPAVRAAAQRAGARGWIDTAEAFPAFDAAVATTFLPGVGASLPASKWDEGTTTGGRRMSTLLYAGRLHSSPLVDFLATKVSRIDVLDLSNRSVLHHMAAGGIRYVSAQFTDLIGKLPPERHRRLYMPDRWGLTPADIERERERPAEPPPPLPPELPMPVPGKLSAAQRHGGWQLDGAPPAGPETWWEKWAAAAPCEVDVYNAPAPDGGATAGGWPRRHAAVGRPTLLRGAVPADHTLRRIFLRPVMKRRFGDLQIHVGDVPYAEQWRGPGSGRSTTLGEYIDEVVEGNNTQDYAFLPPSKAPLFTALYKAFKEPIAGGMKIPPGLSLQAYAGGRGTGAPFHQHHDAINYLMFGRKLWLLYPPEQAVFSADSVASWLRASERWGGGTPPRDTPQGVKASRPFRCVQRAGDAIYVPTMWAHATVNLETAVGFAGEMPREDMAMPEVWPFVN